MKAKVYEQFEVEQITPAHADKVSGYDWSNRKGVNVFDDMFKNEHAVVQRKHDGERMKMHFTSDKEGNAVVVMDSRRISKKTGMFKQCQSNFKCFSSLALINDASGSMHAIDLQGTEIGDVPQFGYTVIDGELKATRKGKDSWSDIVGVIHSLPERAEQLMASNEFEVSYMVFDCMFFDGKDIRDMPYEYRYACASKVVNALSKACDKIKLVTNIEVKSKAEAYAIRDDYVEKGYEGIVIKSLSRKYSDVGAYIKAKRTETRDLVVYGYELGNGKYAMTVGALKCGYYDPVTDSIIHVTDVNCGTDKDRDEWLQGFNDGSRKNGVLEVKCQQITETSLRHPVYVRYRPDKDCKMCTKDTIFDEEHE